MKSFAIFLPVFIICIVFVFVLPHLVRLPILRMENLPVGVTSMAVGSRVIDAPESIAIAADSAQAYAGLIGLNDFTNSLYNGQAGQVVGVYVPGLFALPVRQQPLGQPDYVDRENNVVTEFSLPKKYGSTGLLAHNYLSGSHFSQLKENQDITLVYGDGHLENYQVSQIIAFQALKPESPFSNFIDISNPGNGILSSADVFNRVYTIRHSVVFQTCIENDGEPSWGRLFIIATLSESLHLNVPSLELTSSN